MSQDMGDQIRAHPSWKIRINFDITIETRLIHVVTGDVKGTVDPAKFVMLGAHMDNVYVNNGAVDDGVGTTTILELAHQLAAQAPRYTIRLAAFAGEEQGLWGSQDWRDAHIEEVNHSMIAMFQFDMNHIDIERCSDMFFYTNDNATLPVLAQSERKVHDGTASYAAFTPHVEYADVSQMGSDMASFAAVGKSAYFAHGCGSWEYHTYLDDINRVTMPSLGYSGRVFASVALWLANK
jgi:peptide methionine sulfoxide reductase MsrA